jgi:hypothetical protein
MPIHADDDFVILKSSCSRDVQELVYMRGPDVGAAMRV